MSTMWKGVSYRRIVVPAAFVLLLNLARGSGDLFESFSAAFLDSLGYTRQTIEKIKGGTMTETEAEHLRLELEEKGQVAWQALWHVEFDDPLEGEGGKLLDLGEYDLNIERSDEGLSAGARHVVDQLTLVAISCTRKIDALVKAKEEDASPVPTVGDKVIYSIVKLLQEERHVQWPALEEWAELSTSENPVYRLISLDAANFATPQQLGLRNRWKVPESDPETEKVLDEADLAHFSRFLNDAHCHIRTEAAKAIEARINTVAIPIEVQKRVRDILTKAS